MPERQTETQGTEGGPEKEPNLNNKPTFNEAAKIIKWTKKSRQHKMLILPDIQTEINLKKETKTIKYLEENIGEFLSG